LPSPVLGYGVDGRKHRVDRTVERIVCFDLGGVLVRTCNTWTEACRAAGLPCQEGPSDPEFEEKLRAVTALLDLGRISIDVWVHDVSLALEGAYSPREVRLAHDAISQEEHAGALALVEALHDSRVETACLSNTNHSHWARLVNHDGVRPVAAAPEYPGVARLKQHFASHILGLAKPDAAIYAEFERRTGLHGHDILFFDDRVENVEGARRRDWRAHRIEPHRDPIAQVREFLRDHQVPGFGSSGAG
jgi:FMN phosphatase YigB (HAD superfamily)